MNKYKCLFCGDTYTNDEIRELKEMGEKMWKTEKEFVCPDCYDDLRRLPLEEQAKALLQGNKYEWEEQE